MLMGAKMEREIRFVNELSEACQSGDALEPKALDKR